MATASAARAVMGNATKKALQSLSSTSKVAHNLDWRKASGSVLSVQVSKDNIHLAVASHPSLQEPALTLASIPIQTKNIGNRRVVDDAVSTELSQICKQFNVCGLIIDWPVQKEGRCGADCGRVLNTLDQLKHLGDNRPLCLYDSKHRTQVHEDCWGRAAIYGQPAPSSKTYYSSKESQQTEEKTAVAVWEDFCRDHWPAGESNSNTGKNVFNQSVKPKKSIMGDTRKNLLGSSYARRFQRKSLATSSGM